MVLRFLLVQAILLGTDLLHLAIDLLQQLRVALGHGLDHLVPGKEAGNILAPQQRGDNAVLTAYVHHPQPVAIGLIGGLEPVVELVQFLLAGVHFLLQGVQLLFVGSNLGL